MASYSTIPRAKAALLALLTARAGLAGVSLGWDRSAELQAVTDRIYLFDTIEHHRDWVVLGPRRIDEEYTLQVVVDTFGNGTDPTTTEERLWELVSEVEQAVITDIEIGDTVRQSKPDGVTSSLVPTDEGWIASATVRIVCEARL